jgi:hypothetical protein
MAMAKSLRLEGEKMIEVRGQRVILDREVAVLYGVETKKLKEVVKNNPEKFPLRYTFKLHDWEWGTLASIEDHLNPEKWFSHGDFYKYFDENENLTKTIKNYCWAIFDGRMGYQKNENAVYCLIIN